MHTLRFRRRADSGQSQGARAVAKTPEATSRPCCGQDIEGSGVGLLLLGVINNDDHITGWGNLVLIIGAFLPSGLRMVLHNRRVALH